MRHPDEYWHPILLTPNEDGLRLRYANWLDQHNEPLADFIRIQCELARLPAQVDDADRLEMHALRLQQEHGPRWARRVSDHVDWWAFQRGFVEEVSLSAEQLTQGAEELFQLAPLQDLHVVPDGSDLDRLPSLDGLNRTLFLDVSAYPLGDAGLVQLAQAPFLTHVHGLNLSSCSLGDDALQILGESPYLEELRELYLCDNGITDAGIRRFAMTPMLEKLDLLYVRLDFLSRDCKELLRRILGNRVHF